MMDCDDDVDLIYIYEEALEDIFNTIKCPVSLIQSSGHGHNSNYCDVCKLKEKYKDLI